MPLLTDNLQHKKNITLFTRSLISLTKSNSTYISSVDIEVMPTAKACCFPSAMIAYEKEKLKHYDNI